MKSLGLFLLLYATSASAWPWDANAEQANPVQHQKLHSQRVCEYVEYAFADTVVYPCVTVELDTMKAGEQFEGHIKLKLTTWSVTDESFLETFYLLPDSVAAYNIIPKLRGNCDDGK